MSEVILNVTDEFIKSYSFQIRGEIVRCKDCKHWATEARFTGMCVGRQFDPDGFCKWGERRGDAE